MAVIGIFLYYNLSHFLRPAEKPGKRTRASMNHAESIARRSPFTGLFLLFLILLFSSCLRDSWIVRRLFYPPEIGMASPPSPQNGGSFDHQIYSAILKDNVEQGKVHYGRLAKDRRLDKYLESLAGASTTGLSTAEKLAFYINAYNAFTLRLILDHPGIGSIRDIPESERWKKIRWVAARRTLSLDMLEHEIIRREFQNPYIHFALVCASKSCPPLRTEAYTGSILNEQLSNQARLFLSGPENFRLEGNVLRLSEIFDWYRTDFSSSSGSVLQFLSGALPETAQDLLKGNPRIEFFSYDWSLNGDWN